MIKGNIDIQVVAANEYRKAIGPFPASQVKYFKGTQTQRYWWHDIVEAMPESAWDALTSYLPERWDEIVDCKAHDIGIMSCCSFINDKGMISSIPIPMNWDIL